MKSKVNNSAKFWNRIALKYSKKPIEDEESYQKKLKITQSYFTPEMKVLEFGCGTGSTAITHAKYVNTILATDLSEKMIDIARQKAQAEQVENVIFKTTSIEDLEIEDDSMDVILGLSILHLLENMPLAISKTYHGLKTNGLFISSTVCIGNMNTVMKLMLKLGKKIGIIPYINFITVSELKQNLIDVGFEIIKTWQPKNSKVIFIIAKKR